MDGGLRAEEIPHEIKTSADLPKMAGATFGSGFDDQAVRGIMGGNWLPILQQALPE